jgi:hypothetical protein
LVSEVMDILEYVFVGNGKVWMSKFEEGCSWCGAAWGVETAGQWLGNASVSRCFFLPIFNQSFRNAGNIHWLGRFLICPFSLPTAEPRVKMKPVNTECGLLIIWLVSWCIFSARWTPLVTQTIHCMLFCLHAIGPIQFILKLTLVTSDSDNGTPTWRRAQEPTATAVYEWFRGLYVVTWRK